MKTLLVTLMCLVTNSAFATNLTLLTQAANAAATENAQMTKQNRQQVQSAAKGEAREALVFSESYDGTKTNVKSHVE